MSIVNGSLDISLVHNVDFGSTWPPECSLFIAFLVVISNYGHNVWCGRMKKTYCHWGPCRAGNNLIVQVVWYILHQMCGTAMWPHLQWDWWSQSGDGSFLGHLWSELCSEWGPMPPAAPEAMADLKHLPSAQAHTLHRKRQSGNCSTSLWYSHSVLIAAHIQAGEEWMSIAVLGLVRDSGTHVPSSCSWWVRSTCPSMVQGCSTRMIFFQSLYWHQSIRPCPQEIRSEFSVLQDIALYSVGSLLKEYPLQYSAWWYLWCWGNSCSDGPFWVCEIAVPQVSFMGCLWDARHGDMQEFVIP